MFILLRSNHTVFLVQFGINLHLVSFSKSQIASPEAARCNFSFLKNSLVQINSKLNSKRMITCTNMDICKFDILSAKGLHRIVRDVTDVQ